LRHRLVDALCAHRDAPLMATKDQLATLPRKKVLGMAAVERESAILTAEIDTIDKKLADAVEIHAVTASIVGQTFTSQ
jgi:site-specific DNA recombinase